MVVVCALRGRGLVRGSGRTGTTWGFFWVGAPLTGRRWPSCWLFIPLPAGAGPGLPVVEGAMLGTQAGPVQARRSRTEGTREGRSWGGSGLAGGSRTQRQQQDFTKDGRAARSCLDRPFPGAEVGDGTAGVLVRLPGS